MKLSKRSTRRVLYELQNNTEETMSHESNNNQEEMSARKKQIMKSLEKNHPKSMNEVINNVGHNVDDQERMAPARALEEMVDEAQLKARQEHIINKHCYCAHGTRSTEPEAKSKNEGESICYCIFFSCMLQIGLKHVEFTSFTHEHNRINIKCKCREIDMLLQHHVEVEEWFDFKEENQNVGCMELVVGDDHVKGICTILVSIVTHFLNERDPEALDLECGRVECHQDKLELSTMLIGKLKPSLDRIAQNGLGCSSFVVASTSGGEHDNFKCHSNHHNIENFNDKNEN